MTACARSCRARRGLLAAVLGSVLSLGPGCTDLRDELPQPSPSPAPTAALAPAVAAPATRRSDDAPYPKAPWRLRRDLLADVILCASHVVVAHAESTRPDGSLWAPEFRAPRPRDEAARLARRLRDDVARDPGRFAEVAREQSDDDATAPWGGVLGCRAANQLPDAFLDAIDALKPGEVSRVVETAWGFHLVKLHPAPPERTFSGVHVLVAPTGTVALLRVDRPAPRRDRATARRLAIETAARLRAAPGKLAEVVQEISDAEDVLRGGDLGVLSTRDEGSLSLRRFVLDGLALDAVSDPVEDEEGFHVLVRRPDAPRERLGMSEIFIAFRDAPGWSEGPGRRPTRSRDEARSVAEQAARTLSRDPARFEHLRRELCDLPACEGGRVTLVRGSGSAAVERALLGVEVGAVAPVPVESAFGFHVVRRNPPDDEPPRRLETELPRPAPVPLETLLERAPGESIVPMAAELHAFAVGRLPLSVSEGPRLHRIFTSAASGLAGAPRGARAAVLGKARGELRALLGEVRYELFVRSEREWLVAMQMGS